jgi:hypothetical protein
MSKPMPVSHGVTIVNAPSTPASALSEIARCPTETYPELQRLDRKHEPQKYLQAKSGITGTKALFE